MTKPNGRGRGWRKKSWQDLAPSTQKRYTRLGITPTSHALGITPTAINRWLAHQEKVYGWQDNGDGTYTMSVNGREETGELPKGRRLVQLMEDQKAAEAAFESGDVPSATGYWDTRDTAVPEFMYFYHGIFG